MASARLRPTPIPVPRRPAALYTLGARRLCSTQIAFMWVLLATIAAACNAGVSNVPQGRVAGEAAIPSATPLPAHAPASWMARLDPPMTGTAIDLECLDRNVDRRLNAADGRALRGVDIWLTRSEGCDPLDQRREWFVADADPPLACDAAPLASSPAPLLVVAIAGGGTQLLDRGEGVSVGLIDIVNGIRASTAASGAPTGVILMTSAIESATLPQTAMEEWLVADLARRFDATPCLRVVLIGHSHGAVVATSVMAALEARHSERMYGVLLDRSLLYYDRQAIEMPRRAALLNVFQLNEGWHGELIDAPNVINLDMSAEVAPRDPREGPEPIVAVAHPTLDDSPAVQRQIVTEVATWIRAAESGVAP